jgi:triosephosphate isomerase
MSRKPLIAGNWKLNLGPGAAREHAVALRTALLDVEDVDLVVFPTALSIAGVLDELASTNIGVGVQWAHASAKGAHTGCNAAGMARELGCGWLLAGHSECRADLGETDARVNGSIHEGLASGLLPMMCLGESLAQREAGELESVLSRQLEQGLAGLTPDQVATCTLAYEPIWAIGTGVTATPAQAQDAHAFIRGWLSETYPAFVAEQMRILYGGSVKPGNAAELLANPDIDGALVGGASLKADSFAGIVAAAR